ncbi:MAG: class I SAM-dependent methyltransferase [Pseudoalteromonas marina]|mgnify:CR=1 FL=1|uniref:class I SAM-dependent methyltransferase n=1 Tax=Pseudoalteromonas simplex TaxID=2783613 RepID=UPI001886D373|nr:class I SAM-dependent methyltransferase [Pseudoalteromonas sp. A520]
MSSHWSEYWSGGHLTSFGSGFKKNYEGELKEFWEATAKKFGENSTVLDVGTGNGALIELIQNNNQFNCYGIDKAEMHKGVTQSINGTFLAKTSVECLPFNDNVFSNVIAQFSLEYSQVSQSIDEIYRVLSSGGSFTFVCHHPESIIVKPNKKILKAANFIKSDIENHLIRLVKSVRSSNLLLSKQIVEEIEAKVITHFKYEQEALKGTNLPAFIEFLLQNIHGNLDFEEAYRLFMEELDLLIKRLSELVAAAKNTKNILEQLKALSIEVEGGQLLGYESCNILATYIHGSKCNS